jgi:hypothetical protein
MSWVTVTGISPALMQAQIMQSIAQMCNQSAAVVAILTQHSQRFTKCVEKPTGIYLRDDCFERARMGEIKMSATRGSAHYTGLSPVELSDEPLPIRPTSLENDWFQNEPSLRKRALRALFFLIAFCSGVAATCAWWSDGNAARQLIASSYPQLSWLAPRGAITAQKTPDMVALDAVLRDLNAMRQSVDRAAASQEQITRGID